MSFSDILNKPSWVENAVLKFEFSCEQGLRGLKGHKRLEGVSLKGSGMSIDLCVEPD